MTVDHDARSNTQGTVATSPQRTAQANHAAGDRAGDRSDAGHADASWLIIALLSLVGFVLLTATVARSVVIPFDQPLLVFAQGWDGYPDVWNVISQSANIPLIVIGIGFVLWLVRTKQRRQAVLVIVVLVAVTAGSEGIKQLTGRPRPAGTGDGIGGVVFSYPSGHVLEALTILGMVVLQVWRSSAARWVRRAFVILLIVEVALVGFARMALSEHYPSDVLAGLLGGIGVLALYAWLTRPGAWADKSASDAGIGRADRNRS
jgi:undecaprenyl-diphosphatase